MPSQTAPIKPPTMAVAQPSAAVVDFATVSNAKPRRTAQPISHPDAELIENYVAYLIRLIVLGETL
jgi:hypothetical protein